MTCRKGNTVSFQAEQAIFVVHHWLHQSGNRRNKIC